MVVRKKMNPLLMAALMIVVMAFTLVITTQTVSAANEFTGKTSGYEAVLYDISNGLPTSEANAIVQGKEGFIWIGSYGGLIRYDGAHFYDYNKVNGIANVISLYMDSRERLLIGTNDSGLVIMENNEFTFHSKKDGLQSSCVRTILEDSKGNIIFGTNQGLGYLDAKEQPQQIRDERLDQEEITMIKNAPDGSIYGVTYSGSVFKIKDLKVTEFYTAEELGHGLIYSVYPDPHHPGKVYLGTEGSEIIHGRLGKGMKGAAVSKTGKQSQIFDMLMVNEHLWIGANNGIGFLDQKGKYSEFHEIPMNNAVHHIMIDEEGDLWFTSTHQGVMKVVKNRFTDISAAANLKKMIVNCTHMQGKDMYIGTETGLMILDEDLNRKENDLTALLKEDRIRSIYPDSKGKLWVSSNGEHGLVCYDPDKDSFRMFTPQEGLADDRPRICLELSDGSLAVATSSGVNIIKNNKVIDTWNQEDGLENTWILSLAEGNNGEVYVGTDGGGIFRMQDGVFTHLGFEEGLESEVIMRMRQDPVEEDLIWLVTGNSIAYLRDGRITTVTNFPYSNNFDIVFNRDGQMWVLSGDGVYVVERKDMLANDEIRYNFYDSTCGLPCIATANSYSELDDDGTLYIAGTTGIASVNVNDHKNDDYKVNLTVPYLLVNGDYVNTRHKTKVTIPSDCKRLEIHAFGMTYRLTDPHISYQLEGFDEEPTVVTRREMGDITYTNLNGGSYHFRMEQLDSVTGEPIQRYDLEITKEKAFYEHMWFLMLLVIVAIMSIAFFVLQYYKRKNEKLEEQAKKNRELINEMTSVFAKCIDSKDHYTNGHSTRVAHYACMIAERMGKSESEIEELHNIALLHDIGKISIPNEILNKPGRLNDDEFAIMRDHAQRGSNILEEISIAPDLALGARYHHERPDGRGYPQGLKKEDIPEYARIISVADTFDAMFSTRPYRKKMPLDKVAEEIRRNRGTQFDEEIADVLLAIIDEGVFDRMDPSRGGDEDVDMPTPEQENGVSKDQSKMQKQVLDLIEEEKKEDQMALS